jgi:hypothetical protein
MHRFFLFVIIFSIFLGCGSSYYSRNKNTAKNIRCINLYTSLPALDRDGKLIQYLNGSNNIFYYDNIIMTQIPVHFDSYDSNKLVKEETKNSFFVYEKNNTYGLYYTDFSEEKKKKLPIDSVNDGVLKADLYEYFKTNALQLISSRRNRELGILEEIYIGKLKYAKDTAIFYFSDRLKDFDFSFSKKLDSLKKLKLFKFRYVSDEEILEEYKVTLPKREVNFEIKEIPVDNPKEIMSYFERYKKDFHK